jgi:hypothetical protein
VATLNSVDAGDQEQEPMTHATRFTAVVAMALAFGSHVAPVAADAPCDGVYRSWGRTCQGSLVVRSKTIEWNSPFSVCKPSPYAVLDSELEGDERRVVYRIKKRNKACAFDVIEVFQFGDDMWSMRGYPSVEAYERRNDDAWLAAKEGRAPLACVADPLPSKRCNLDFARKKQGD